MESRKSSYLLLGLAIGIGLVLFLPLHAYFADRHNTGFLRERATIVNRYGLSDLCLFTDARYTRNPAVADVATAFQDHPVSLEHFPSGSIIPPPERVRHGLD